MRVIVTSNRTELVDLYCQTHGETVLFAS